VNIHIDVSLRPYHTFHTPARTRYFTVIRSADDLLRIYDALPDEPKLILGEGSNVLFLDDFPGIVIRNEMKGLQVHPEKDNKALWEIRAGENWHEIVQKSVEAGHAGIENLALIPGKAGTAPVQNIGAYGREIKDVLHSCDVLDLETGRMISLRNEDCGFGYRHSIFKTPAYKGRYFIHTVRLELTPGGKPETGYGALQAYLENKGITDPTIKDVFDAVVQIRRSKLPDPNEVGNAGSFFKNPILSRTTFEKFRAEHPEAPFYPTGNDRYKIPAAWLIDRAGWKGYREKDAGVHPKQPLVLVNYGNATGREIYDLSEKIRLDIREKFQIDLEREVNIIDPSLPEI